MKDQDIYFDNGFRIGYHYTSLKCYRSIQEQGIIPYKIHKPELSNFFKDGIFTGIWIWTERLEGLSHAGSVIFQMSNKGEPVAVMLQVIYHVESLLQIAGYNLLLSHFGVMNNLKYHTGNEKARILTHEIPADRIKLLGIYDLGQAFNDNKAINFIDESKNKPYNIGKVGSGMLKKPVRIG